MSRLDLRKESENRFKNKGARKYKKDTKLQELEKQLEFAESRCGTLKQQLNYIKRLYGCGKGELPERQSLTEEGRGDGYNVNYYYHHGDFLGCSNRNREDGDGLNFNGSSEVIVQLKSSGNSSEKNVTEEKDESKKKTTATSKAVKLKMKKKTARKIKKKRVRVERQTSSKESNASSQTQMLASRDPVVELYKNMALNVESESGLEVIGRGVAAKRSGIFPDTSKQKLKKFSNHKLVDAKDDLKTKSCGSVSARKEETLKKDEGMQTDQLIDENLISIQNKRSDINDTYSKCASVRAESVYAEPVKSYCMPTISSKRKQVERDIYSNIGNINVRNIPFIVAKSTAPSHNIGVNIQQVLSIMKKRQHVSENLNSTENGHYENPVLTALVNSKKTGNKGTEQGTVAESCTGISVESKKRVEAPRSNLSHWTTASEEYRETSPKSSKAAEDDSDWNSRVERLKNVLVFLHEDFTSLSQKYKRLQKKLTKRNITRTDAKDELAEIERELEKKEEEITIVIELYKEVLNLKEDIKKLQEKFELIACGRNLISDELRQSNSAHVQMTSLLRKIQKFQDKLKT